jgi:hypothetical protein
MNCSFARSLTFTIALVLTALVPASANAVSLPPDNYLLRLIGHTALTRAADDTLHTVDLRSGKSTPLGTLASHLDARSVVLQNGILAATAWVPDSYYSAHMELFTSGPDGEKTLATWATSVETCHSDWRPLGVDEQGRLTVLRISFEPAGKFKPCAVKTSDVGLFRFGKDGTKEKLYFPNTYKRWITADDLYAFEPSFSLRGDRLLMSQSEPHSRVAVLNLRKRKVLRFKPGKRLSSASFTGPSSILVTRLTKSGANATRFSATGRVQKEIYSGPLTGVASCGTYTAISSRTGMSIRDRDARTVYRYSTKATYESGPYIQCSGAYLQFSYADEGCSQCGPMPSESKLLDLGKLG